jgi:hypothetical protein
VYRIRGKDPTIFRTGTSGTLPIFADTVSEFWNELDSRRIVYHLHDLIQELEFWNDTSMTWDMIYGNMRNSSNARFDMVFYPFEDSSILLCHTLQKGLAEFGTKFKLVLDPAASFCK